MKPVILTGIAEADVERAAIWYEKRKEGLGARFAFRVRETIGRIGENPAGYAKAIGVIGCLHGRRDWLLAKERAPEYLKCRNQKNQTSGVWS